MNRLSNNSAYYIYIDHSRPASFHGTEYDFLTVFSHLTAHHDRQIVFPLRPEKPLLMYRKTGTGEQLHTTRILADQQSVDTSYFQLPKHCQRPTVS